MEIRAIAPAGDEPLARELLAVQRAAYAVEAGLLGDHRIPPLHERLEDLRRRPCRWLAAFEAQKLVGAIAWTADATQIEVDRLVVSPASHRRGIGRRLVEALIGEASGREVIVSTGRGNFPARRLYETLGFVRTGEHEVLPGLWVTCYARSTDAPETAHPGSARRS